jgi:hypothetical protein
MDRPRRSRKRGGAPWLRTASPGGAREVEENIGLNAIRAIPRLRRRHEAPAKPPARACDAAATRRLRGGLAWTTCPDRADEATLTHAALSRGGVDGGSGSFDRRLDR